MRLEDGFLEVMREVHERGICLLRLRVKVK